MSGSEDDPTRIAVSLFWTTRRDQMSALEDGGKAGGGARGDRHLNGLRKLVSDFFVEAGVPAEGVKNERYIPGYYRPRKRWDLTVHYKGSLVAALELKSQVGSVGKNVNNRFEEALGSATDAWAAQSKLQSFGAVPPWFGYVFVLREDEETEAPKNRVSALFPVDKAFQGMSYNERYQEMLKRFIGDNIYQAGWFITTKITEDGKVSYKEPLATASGQAFRVQVENRVKYIKAVLG